MAWLLVSAPLLAITGILLFTIPRGSPTIQVIWVMISYNLFYSFAYTIYNMSHTLMVPLSTRDITQRGSLSVFNNVAAIMVSGIIVALLFPMLILPSLGVDQGKWITVMSVISILAFPLTLIEYYFTKERVTEEMAGRELEPISMKRQLKAVLTDQYWVVIILYYFLYTLGANLKNVSLVYYANYVLGTYNDGITQTLISVIGGLPSAYVFLALFADVLDHMEWKAGFRVDGLSASVNTVNVTICYGLSSGLFNLLLARSGYIAPKLVDGKTVAAVQNLATQRAIIFSFLGLEIITALILVVLLAFLSVEKVIEQEQAEILARQKKN